MIELSGFVKDIEFSHEVKGKLYYNGMSVGIIDKIANYLQPDYSYIKGKIIRIENASDDYHNVETIAEELNKGVFIK